MKIRYLSHASFELKNGITLLIDPYFQGNPLAPRYEGKPDLILVTHEHYDHGVDAGRYDCLKVCPPTCSYKKMERMRIGEKRTIMGMPIEMISASHHQSKYPTGYVFEYEGKRIAHLGDTYLEGVSNLGNIDILFVPIGGYYTMSIDEAIKALRIIRPGLAIPMHYDTFPQIKASPQEFKAKAEKEGFKIRVMKFGEEIEL